MRNIQRSLICVVIGVTILVILPVCGFAQNPVPPVPNPCTPRFTAGSVIQNPPALFSHNGVLNVQFSYQQTTDSFGRQLFCFMTPSGLQNPTLHVNPGDTLNITVTNNTPFNFVNPPVNDVQSSQLFNAPTCGDSDFVSQTPPPPTTPPTFPMTGGSMNIHYHGTNTSPQCHGDNVVKTLINPVGTIDPDTHQPAVSTFQYNVLFPTNEPPGLYWYHPHVHGLAENALLAGAEGALIVDGIQNVQPAVAGLFQRVIIIRDQQFTQPGLAESSSNTEGGIPQHDLSVDFVPLDTQVNESAGTATYTPAVVQMVAGEPQFWRICNCTSDAPLDLVVRFDGVDQNFQIAGIDAVPVNSQEGPQPPPLITVNHFRLPVASRVEIIVNPPPGTVHTAQLLTKLINSGNQGDNLPTRPLLTIKRVEEIEGEARVLPAAQGVVERKTELERVPAFTGLNTNQQRFAGLDDNEPAVERVVYFEEIEGGIAFFMSTQSCTPTNDPRCQASVQFPGGVDVAFNNNNAPAIVTTQGSVELWHIQNHARENHEFHQHQIHFQVKNQLNFETNGTPSQTAIQNQFLDMVELPFCDGDGPQNVTLPDGRIVQESCLTKGGGPPDPYPQVDALMDFRGMDIGDFVFHCHILGHEDLGMMAIERVVQSLP